MQQPLMLIVLLLAIVVASCRSQVCPGNQQQVLFNKLLHLDGMVLKRDDHVLFQAWVTSKIDCSQRCLGTEGCAVFTFQPGQKHASPRGSCQLYGQLPNATMDLEASPGARSYAKYDNPDPLQCACGYSRLCGRCLTFVLTAMKFTEARQHCHDLNSGRLMVVRSREELDCVSEIIKPEGTMWYNVWVGANDMAEEGRYVWEDGTDLPNGTSLWASGEPSSNYTLTDCIYLRTRYSYTGLLEATCRATLYVMCERDN